MKNLTTAAFSAGLLVLEPSLATLKALRRSPPRRQYFLGAALGCTEQETLNAHFARDWFNHPERIIPVQLASKDNSNDPAVLHFGYSSRLVFIVLSSSYISIYIYFFKGTGSTILTNHGKRLPLFGSSCIGALERKVAVLIHIKPSCSGTNSTLLCTTAYPKLKLTTACLF